MQLNLYKLNQEILILKKSKLFSKLANMNILCNIMIIIIGKNKTNLVNKNTLQLKWKQQILIQKNY